MKNPRSDIRMDIVMITKNSDITNLRKCLNSLNSESIRSNINIKLIIVDGGSTNSTLETINMYNGINTEIYIDKEGNRATARQLGIKKVTTPLFAFIDDDVELSPCWFDILKYFDDPKVGAVWGAAIPTGTRLKYFRSMSKLYGKNIKYLILNNGKRRGLTHDTVIRTDLVKDIKIPKNLHVLEDHYIRLHIEKKGYRWVSTLNPYVYHHRDLQAPGASHNIYYGWKMNLYEKKWYMTHIFFFPFKVMFLIADTRDTVLIMDELKKELSFIVGMFRLLSDKF